MTLHERTGSADPVPMRVHLPLAVGGVAVLTVGCAVAQQLRPHTRIIEVLEAGVAGLIAALAVLVALTLRGVNWRGAVFGGVFVSAGILSWTLMYRPLVIWLVLGAGGVVFLVWS